MFGKDLAATEEQVLPPCFRNQYPRFGDIPVLEETHNPIDESPKNRVHLVCTSKSKCGKIIVLTLIEYTMHIQGLLQNTRVAKS